MNLKGNLIIAAAAVAAVWIVFILERVFPGIIAFGIQPRTLSGLWGLICAPFLHGNLRHIMTNTPPLFVLLLLALSYDRMLAVEAVIIIAVGGGGLVWVFAGAYTNHIGASGIIFGLIGFLLLIGIFRKDAKALTASILVFFMYGGALWSGFAPQPGVSWTSHIFGFLAGGGAAWLAGKTNGEPE